MVAELPDDEALAQSVLIAVRAEPDEWTIADLAQDLGVDFERVRALVVGPLEHQVSLSRLRRLRPREVPVRASGWRPSKGQLCVIGEVRKISPLGLSSWEVAQRLRMYEGAARKTLRELHVRRIVTSIGEQARRKWVLVVDDLMLRELDRLADWVATSALAEVLVASLDDESIAAALGSPDRGEFTLDAHTRVLRRLAARGAVLRMPVGNETAWRLPHGEVWPPAVQDEGRGA
jgi:hypothetical protein